MTEKCDIWALGVIVYALLTGQIPFNTHENKLAGRTIYDSRYFTKVSVRFLRDIFNVNPQFRPSAAEVLQHAWLTHDCLDYVSQPSIQSPLIHPCLRPLYDCFTRSRTRELLQENVRDNLTQ